MTARVLFIGLDAAEATLINQWTEEGHLPTFRKLREVGAWGRLGNPMDTLPGAIWPEITTGRSCGKVGEFYHPTQIHTGEARSRPLEESDIDPEDYFWTIASRAGCKTAVIDMVQTVDAPDFNGIQIREWGLHDRNFKIASNPPGLIQEMNDKYGEHPVQGHACDNLADTEGHDVLLEALLRGSTAKADMLVDLMKRDQWDLFACAFGETHCAGHQLWHFIDPKHPKHDPNAPQHLKNALRSVYANVDKGIGRLIEAAGPGVEVVVMTSHGMRLYTGGPNLLTEFMARLGMGSGGTDPISSQIRQAHNKARYLPWGVKKILRKALELGPVRKLQQSAGASLDPFESSKTRAAPVRNNRVGAIRLNLKGREPYGSVAPGNEARSVIEEIREALYELEDTRQGEKIVEKVVTADEAFGPDHHPDVPDIMVVFRRDLGLLEECWSPRVGRIRAPINSPGYPRTGDHSGESHVWMSGARVAPGSVIENGHVLDIAPTILERLGVGIPGKIDGRPMMAKEAAATA